MVRRERVSVLEASAAIVAFKGREDLEGGAPHVSRPETRFFSNISELDIQLPITSSGMSPCLLALGSLALAEDPCKLPTPEPHDGQ
jgi:hypothetical protein